MKSILFILLLLIQSQNSVLIEKEFEKNSFVGVITIKEISKEYFYAKPVEVYKNSFQDNFNFRIDKRIQLEEGLNYLVFATLCEDDYELFCISPAIAPMEESNITPEMKIFFQTRNCFDHNETLAERKKRNPNLTGACPRGYGIHVCGCNGKTYYSECETHNDGVLKYTLGKCNPE